MLFSAWEAVQRRPIHFWLMQWAYCGIQKTREDTIRLNLIGARSLEGLGASGRLGLESLLSFMYPN